MELRVAGVVGSRSVGEVPRTDAAMVAAQMADEHTRVRGWPVPEPGSEPVRIDLTHAVDGFRNTDPTGASVPIAGVEHLDALIHEAGASEHMGGDFFVGELPRTRAEPGVGERLTSKMLAVMHRAQTDSIDLPSAFPSISFGGADRAGEASPGPERPQRPFGVRSPLTPMAVAETAGYGVPLAFPTFASGDALHSFLQTPNAIGV